ncbi:MAG: EAL domain-containing protein [Candidatus Omnitrophica bacterium]|nr:EAL domain-containing protein [Candidatus Omnitrophota bacterium]
MTQASGPRQKSILLVDDEKDLTQMLRLLLEMRGYQVEVAYTAQQAFKKISHDIDLILLDIVLPDLNGFEVCRKLKEEKITRHIPIIMLSAHCLSGDRVEGLSLGADDFISKPCEHEELVARMEAVIRRTQQSELLQAASVEALTQLKKIRDEGLIIPHFQPIYHFPSMKILGVETLTRLDGSMPLLQPATLFQLALRHGFYLDLELSVWKQALTQLSKRIDSQKIFLNCTPYFIEYANISSIHKLLFEHDVRPEQVILEITEHSAIRNFREFFRRLEKYRGEGFKFALDDVGGGYASLESIMETRPEYIKIDRPLIQDLGQDPFRKSILKFLIAFCQENHIISIAEGVETAKDFHILCELGIDAGQGRYFTPPMSDPTLFLPR